MLDVVANIGYSSSVFASNVDYKDGDDDDDDDMVTWMLDGVVGLGIHFQYWPLFIHHQHTADIIIVIIVPVLELYHPAILDGGQFLI